MRPPALALLNNAVIEGLERRLLFTAYVVNSLADDGSGGTEGVITLRWAIEQANATGGTNTITFAPTLFSSSSQTIYLNGTVLELDDTHGTLNIEGPTGTNTLTINANGTSRVFTVDSDTTAQIDNLTITGGHASIGAGIASTGDLTVQNSTISGNTSSEIGGGIYEAYGTLNISNSQITGNTSYTGGGVYSDYGTLTVEGSTISRNTAHLGAGIATNGTATISGSSFITDNYGIGVFAPGGVTIDGSTVADNTEGGIYSFGLTLVDSVVTGNTNDDGNGGGIYLESYGVCTVTGSTISDNHSGCSGGGIFASQGVVTITSSTISGNSAVNSGGGIQAQYNGAPVDFLTMNVSACTISGNTSASGGGIYNCGTLNVGDSTIITGNTASQLGGGVYASSGTVVVVSSSTITDNSVTGSPGGDWAGGAIFADDASVTIQSTTISGNSSTVLGGGIYANGGAVVTISNSTLADNTAAVSDIGGGGAIFADDASVTVQSSTISGNNGTELGGGIYASRYSSLTVTDSTISGNSAQVNGGGIYDYLGSSLVITNCTITGNSAEYGGAINSCGSGIQVTDSTVVDNYGEYCGGVYSETLIQINGTIVAGNTEFDCGIYGSFEGTNNLIGDGSGGLTAFLGGNILGTSTSPISPMLAPLGYYGGPTETMPLLPGSPALHTGGTFNDASGTTITTDQRGFPLADDAYTDPDIGAVQTQADPLQVNTIQDDPVVAGQLSLRDAVNLANAFGGTQPITFSSSLSTQYAPINVSAGTLATSNLVYDPTLLPETIVTTAGASLALPTTLPFAYGSTSISNWNGNWGGGITQTFASDGTITNPYQNSTGTYTATFTALNAGGGTIYTYPAVTFNISPNPNTSAGSTTATAVSSTQILVTWHWTGAPADQGFEIAAADSSSSYMDYKVVGAADNDGSDDYTASGGPGSGYAVISGLNPSTEYKFRIYAIGSTGSTADPVTATATTAAPFTLSVESSDSGYTYAASGGLSGAVYAWQGSNGSVLVSSTDTTDTLTTTTLLSSLTVTATDESEIPGTTYATGGFDSMTYYTYAPTIVLTGTSGNDSFIVDGGGTSHVYTITGLVSPIPAFAAPGVDLIVQGRGGADSLKLQNQAQATLLNDAGSDGTQLSVALSGWLEGLSIASTQHLASLNVSGDSEAQMMEDGTHVLVLGSLTIDTSDDPFPGRLDLTDNDLIVHNGSLDTLTDLVASAAITSSAAIGEFNELGIAQNSTTSLYTTFDGNTVNNTDVLIKYTYEGDVNLDGTVSSTDATQYFSYTSGDAGWYDYNYVLPPDTSLAVPAYSYDSILNSNASVTSTWNTSGATYTPTGYTSGLPSNTQWLINWGDGTVSQFNGSTPGYHVYNISQGTMRVGITAYDSSHELIYAPPTVNVVIAPATAPVLPAPYITNYTVSSVSAGDYFAPPTLTSVTPAWNTSSPAPAIDQCTNSAQPGDVIALTVEHYNYNSSTTTFWVWGQTTSGNGTLVQAYCVANSVGTAANTSGTAAVSVQLPMSLPANSVYFIWADNGSAFSAPFIINQPEIAWDSVNNAHADESLGSASYLERVGSALFSDADAYPGEQVSLFGQNLSQGDGSLPYSDQTWVYIFNSSGGVAGVVNATASPPDSTGAGAVDVNPYKVDFTLPGEANLPNGIYNIEVYNGHGGGSSLSNWIQLDVSNAALNSSGGLNVGPSYNLSSAVAGWAAANPTQVAPLIYVPLPSDPAETSINPTAVNDAIKWLYTQTGSYAYLTLDLPAGIIEETAQTGSIRFATSQALHLVGADDDPTDPAAGTTIEVQQGAALQQVIDLDLSYGTTRLADALEISNMYILANGGLSSNTDGVIYNVGQGSGFTLDDVTVDSRNGVGYAAWDVLWGNSAAHTAYLNCTFIGQGIANPIGNDMIVDNCNFYGCGEQYGMAAQIYVTEGEDDVSVTRCTDQSLIDNITSPGENVCFDSASRLFVGQVAFGNAYVGDNVTNDLYELPYVDSNGGEQVIVEGDYVMPFQGVVGDTTYSSGYSVELAGFSYNTVNYSINQPSGSTNTLLGFTVQIAAGPGMGESRTIVAYDGTAGILNAPWSVTPTSTSECIISFACSNLTVFQNTLSGDGALSLLGDTVGVDANGLNAAIDDNDISGVPQAIDYEDAGSGGYPSMDWFSLYARNSLHGDSNGIVIQSGVPSGFAALSYTIGNIFRGNIITGPAAPANESSVQQRAGISVSGDTGANDSAQTLMDIFDQNIITNYQIGMQILYHARSSANGSTGSILNLLASNFFSSDGSIGSIGLTNVEGAYGPHIDTDAGDVAYFEVDDLWQSFWDGSTWETL